MLVNSKYVVLTGLLALLGCSGENKPPAGDPAAVAPPAGQTVSASSDPRAAIFENKGCPQCHTISALGIKSPAEIGPDLTLAAEWNGDRVPLLGGRVERLAIRLRP